jgi:hypothetical protein
MGLITGLGGTIVVSPEVGGTGSERMSLDDHGAIGRALTVVQPWAHAIVHLGKDIENRSWKPPETLIGKRFAIHAGCKCSAEALEDFLDDGYSFPDAPVLGAIIVRHRSLVEALGRCRSRTAAGRYVAASPAPLPHRAASYVPLSCARADTNPKPVPRACAEA